MQSSWKNHVVCSACLLAVSAAGCASSAPITQQTITTMSASAAAASLTLHPGDAIKLTVWKAPELNGEFAVAPDGTLAHAAFRSLVVAGVPLPRVQRMLDSAARVENVGANVVMQPLLHVVVGGEVRSPNVYRFPVGTSISEAVVLAGGRTEQADPTDLRLVRDGRVSRFDLTELGGEATRAAVASGDELLIGRGRASFRETVLPYLSVIGTLASVTTLILRSR